MNPTTYSYEEAFQATLAYFDGDELAARVWVNKYAMKDSFGNIYEKSPADMHHRLAGEMARIERKYPNPVPEEEIFSLLDHFRFIIPAGSPMTGIGNNYQVASLSNCFVIGIDGDADSYGAIMKEDEEQVQLMKRRGGVGHDLSRIRPKGSPVNNSALTSTGLVPFMERFSNSTREVAQDGRRGALMLSVSIKHPDAEAFIDAKMTEGKVTGANVSVRIDDDFMRCATEGRPYRQQYPVDAPEDECLTSKEIDAQKLWKRLSTTLGRAPSRAFFSGIPSRAKASPTAMPTWASKRCQPILAAKFRSVPTTVAVFWPSISTVTLTTRLRLRLLSISSASANTCVWHSVSWTTSSTSRRRRLTSS